MEEYVSHAIAHFGAKILKESDSSVCSPLSVEIMMAMLALGCKDKSNHEILKVLNFPDDDALRSSFAHLTSTLKSIKGAKFNVANKIYVKTGAELKPGVKKDAVEVFESSVEELDFHRQEAVVNAIQNWVAQQTNGNTSIELALDESTRLVLVNAISFQGAWEKPFDTRQNITDFPFHESNNKQRSVTFMKMTETWFQYGVSPELNARLLQLWFEGGEASMVIVLPNEIEGLNSVIQKLALGHNVMADIKSLRKTELDVMLPKFEGRSMPVHLVSHLIKLGIKTIFDERKSEMNMLTADEKLFGSNAGQMITMGVDEREIAETAYCAKSGGFCTDHRTPCFVADRPFLYLVIVRDVPIFMGTYKDSRQDVVNYSCNNLNHFFSLSSSTFYSRYENTREQERLRELLEFYASRVILEASDHNRVNNRRRERRIIDDFPVRFPFVESIDF